MPIMEVKFKVNPDCTRDSGTQVTAHELQTRPGYINTRILPGLDIKVMERKLQRELQQTL